jgi:hypothetical protein
MGCLHYGSGLPSSPCPCLEDQDFLSEFTPLAYEVNFTADNSFPFRPISTYASEIWVLKENSMQKLLIFVRKILRKIFGRTKESNGLWRIKTNEELDDPIQ